MTEKKPNPGPAIAFTMPAIVTIAIFLMTSVFAAGGWAVSSHTTGLIVDRHDKEISALEDMFHSIDTRLSVIEICVEKIENIVERSERRDEE